MGVSLQLTADRLGAECHKPGDRRNAKLKFFHCAEFAGVLFHIRADQFRGGSDHLLQFSAVKPFLQKRPEQRMVLLGVRPVGKDPGQHGAVIIAAVNGIVDGRVDRA